MVVRTKPFMLTVAALLLAGGFPALSTKALELSEPVNMDTVEDNVAQVQDDLQNAQCGGWDFDLSVEEFLPAVTGAPGRRGIVFEGGAIKPEAAQTGMAWRDEASGTKQDGFSFPGSGEASGYSTVCKIREFGGDDFPYRDDLSPAPFDPAATGSVPCRNPGACEQMCTDLNAWQFPRNLCPDADGGFTVVQDGDCRDVRIDNGTQTSDGCVFNGWMYCCSRTRVSDPKNDATRNCIPCSGDGLEDPRNPGHDGNKELIADLSQTGCRQGKDTNNRSYVSFFRRFSVSYEREPMTAYVPQDDAHRKDVPVECYGRYREFDPKLLRTGTSDRRCVIVLKDREGEKQRFDGMPQSQIGKGSYGEDSNLKDPAFPRSERDTLRNLWENNFSGAFSLLNGSTIREDKNDRLFPLLQLDSADLRATAQLDAQRKVSEGNLIRSLDESVSNQRPDRRTLTEWWQEQETQAHKLFTAPMLRLILPTPASVGLDLSDPLLSPVRPSATVKPQIKQRTIDLQIRADPEDMLSEVSAYLENALLLHVQEEPVPLVVPLGSPVELRALAQGWLRWGEERGEGEARTKAELVAEKLEQYAQRADRVRALRGELAQYLGRLLAYQTTMNTAIGAWLTNNLQTWERYTQEEDARLQLKPLWQAAQQQMRVFHDRTNFPWCRSDRFSTPVYSFLDDWMPGPPQRDLALNIDAVADNDPDGNTLPRLFVEQLPDVVYDFTVLRVSTGTVLLPVLKPIQIRLFKTLLDPPAYYEDMAAVSDRLEKLSQLPDLPPVPTIFAEVLQKMLPEDVLNPASPSVVTFAIPQLDPKVEPVLRRIMQMTDAMSQAYQKFWDSIAQYPKTDVPEGKWDCRNPDTMPCIHAEMDLLERFTRIGARPAIALKEDFLSKGPARRDVIKDAVLLQSLPSSALKPHTAFPPCPREDWSCQVFSAQKTFAREGWRVEGVQEGTKKDALRTLRNRLRQETIPSNVSGAFPYIIRPADMLPSFNVPGPIPLSGSAPSPLKP